METKLYTSFNKEIFYRYFTNLSSLSKEYKKLFGLITLFCKHGKYKYIYTSGEITDETTHFIHKTAEKRIMEKLLTQEIK